MTERSIEDRMGEAMRKAHHGGHGDLWDDLSPGDRARWRYEAGDLLRAMSCHSLKVAVQEGDEKDE